MSGSAAALGATLEILHVAVGESRRSIARASPKGMHSCLIYASSTNKIVKLATLLSSDIQLFWKILATTRTQNTL